MNHERPIEKLLRRYAKKRGDEAGAPPELHPATRRLLQGEVARQFPKPASENKPSTAGLFSLLLRRWIYAVGIFLVLGVAAVILLPGLNQSKNGEMLAQKSLSEERMARESVASAASTLAPAAPLAESQPTLTTAENRRNQPAPALRVSANSLQPHDESATLSYSVTNTGAVGSRARFADAKADADTLSPAGEVKQVSSVANRDSAVPATRTLTVPSPARAASGTKPVESLALGKDNEAGRSDPSVTEDGYAEKRRAATPPPASVAVAEVPALSLADKALVTRGGGAEKDAEQFNSQSFANVATEPLKAKAAKAEAATAVTPVLVNFKIQQNGNEVRVIDGDGSTYIGVINASAGSFGRVGGGGGFGGGGRGGALGDPRQTATGTFQNADQPPALATPATAPQSLVQNYLWRVEGTNRTLNQNVVFTWNFVETNALAVSQLQSASAQSPLPFPAQMQNALIYGRAQLGPAQQIEVNAVPVKP